MSISDRVEPRTIDPLLAERDQFPILSQTNYLISNSLGAMPLKAQEALHTYAETWASRGVRAWEETWWTLTADLGDRVAPLIGAQADHVVFQPNVTLAHAIIFSALAFESRSKIVTDAMHFPSILYLIDGLKQRGARPVIVPSDDGLTIDTQRVIDAIDKDTAAVNISHILYKTAYIHEVEAIAEKARRVGALTIVDGYQSVGVIPVDVDALGVDIYIGGCLKWLCGGPGNAFLWVDPDLQTTLTPTLTGWMADRRPFEFAPELDRREDAWRFLHGTPNISGLYAARPGLDIINRVGVDSIREKSRRQTQIILERAASLGLPCRAPSDPDRRGGTVAIDPEHGYEISRCLKVREILCDYRPGAGIRLSPHFYTHDREILEALDAIVEIQKTGAWQDFDGPRAIVT